MYFEDFLAAAGLADCKFVPRVHDDDVTRYTVFVPRARLQEARAWYYALPQPQEFDVTFRQATPPLVPAKVGDLVLVYREAVETDAESPFGVVTAVALAPDGAPLYRCAQVVCIPGSWATGAGTAHDFILADDQTHARGVLAVLTPADAVAHLTAAVERGHAQAVAAADGRRARSLAAVPALVTALGGGTAYATTVWSPPDNFPVGTNVRLIAVRPERYVDDDAS
jgi:hypothetical protein